MKTRSYVTAALAGLLAGALSIGVAHAQKTVKIGASAPKTGPLAVGASITHWPNVKLWVETVNARGGLKLRDGQRKIELIEYDDRTTPGEAIKNVTRLATQDKADFILAPYGTGFNLATAAIFAKFGYPMVTSTSITDKQEELVKRYPGIFFTLGSTSAFSEGVADVLKKMRGEGKIGKRVAMVNVADAFGIELANAARPVFKKAGFEIVYDKSYPLGTQDLSPVIRGAKAAKPDAFVAWSYPPDTFGLTAQAKVQGLDTKAFYTAVATAFPAGGWGQALTDQLQNGMPLYYLLYMGGIIFFAYFYTAIIFNPDDVAENMRKYGGFIPGIRPGKRTAEHIDTILTRITLVGSIYLALVAVLPDLLIAGFRADAVPFIGDQLDTLLPRFITDGMGVTFYFGGTSLLIIVGVSMDTVQQIESQLIMRHYDGFMKKTRIKGRRG